MDFLDLFILALMPVLKVLLVTAVGLLLAMDRVNLLGPDARSHLNNMVFYVFGPALISSNLAETITWESLGTLWFMPVNILLTLILGSVLGWILIKITRTPPNLKGLILGCCSAGNMGNLLLIILPELCEESSSPFGDSSTCSTNTEAYASLSLAGKVLIFLEKIKQHVNKLTSQIKLKMLLAPGTVAAIVGFIIGLVSPLRKVLIGDSAPLRLIYSSAALIGEAAIPSITLIIGANLLKGLRGSAVGAPIITGIAVIRFIILPALGIGIVKAAIHFGMVGSNSLLQFTLMFQYAVPPAMNIGTISQLLGAGQSECSVIMLWTYAFASFFLTLWSALFIWLVT
ncbi:hypothetical protein SLA2020_384340 [Shorea laevis]